MQHFFHCTTLIHAQSSREENKLKKTSDFILEPQKGGVLVVVMVCESRGIKAIAALCAFQHNLVLSLLFQSCNLLPQKGKQNYTPSTGNSVVWHHGDTPVSHHLSCCHWVGHRPL